MITVIVTICIVVAILLWIWNWSTVLPIANDQHDELVAVYKHNGKLEILQSLLEECKLLTSEEERAVVIKLFDKIWKDHIDK